MELPKFKYHPDPISSGVIIASNQTCECCKQSRGYIYTASFYSEEEVEFICPWCIGNGAASKKFEGIFSDEHPLIADGVPEEIIEEVCKRTPSFISWQQEIWLSHCGVACEFHGDAEKQDLQELSGIKLESFLSANLVKPEHWNKILQHYTKGGNPAVYKFKCTKCEEFIFSMDFA
jgi:uncharacterized protein CbrC (UPF0167 family)